MPVVLSNVSLIDNGGRRENGIKYFYFRQIKKIGRREPQKYYLCFRVDKKSKSNVEYCHNAFLFLFIITLLLYICSHAINKKLNTL